MVDDYEIAWDGRLRRHGKVEIPATKIARYVQVENQIRAQITYDLAASIPFVQ